MRDVTSERRHFATKEEFEAFRDEVWAEYTHTFGNWSFNWATGMVIDAGTKIHLTERESDVLRVLIDTLPQILGTKDVSRELAERYDQRLDRDGVKTYVRLLRMKIGRARISSMRSGYMFVPFPEVE